MELRKVGYSERQIAKAIGATKSSVHRYIAAGLKELVEEYRVSSAQVRAAEIARQQWIISVLHPQLKAGHLGAIDRAQRAWARITELQGGEPPKRVDVGSDPERPVRVESGGVDRQTADSLAEIWERRQAELREKQAAIAAAVSSGVNGANGNGNGNGSE